ncbi:hypothetical protein Focb16_v000228 [Fusarium oxysporum f. sp. cubense]|uniref:Cyanovirin-N domain-containing protein n=1 Tax=Fusarium oxysporum f. sp. cubense TaxID=61366 RepID=A0A559L734_FUSOC|nr:hypothetical protein Focb16_v000228 [Fusarium oxysporum f. sp. cubense]
MFSPLLLLTLTLNAIATSPSSSLNTTNLTQHPSRVAPRFISGGFYDKCKDVRFYLAKADDTHPRKNSFNGYKSSPWVVAKCPDKNGKYLCTWLALSKCLLNSEGELYRGSNGNFHGSCTACKLTGSNFNCGCWSGLKKGKNDFGNRVHRTSIDLNVAVGAVDGYLTCHGNWGILDYCSGRPSHDPFLDSK